MKYNTLWNRFTAGALGNRLLGAVDLEEYKAGAKDLTNFMVTDQGGVTRLPGSYITSQLLRPILDEMDLDFTNGKNPCKLIPFIFNSKETYAILIYPGAPHIRIYRMSPLIGNMQTTSSSSGNAVQLNNANIALVTTDILNIGAWGSINNATFTNGDFHYTQTNDILIITYSLGTLPPLIISRTGLTNFVAEEYLIGVNNLFRPQSKLSLPYRDYNATTTTMTPSATSGSITITASAAFFTAGMVGARIRIIHGSVEGSALISGFTSATSLSANVEQAFGATTAQLVWAISAWNAEYGYPRSVTIFQQRLVFGGTKAEPNRVWCSRINRLFTFQQEKFLQDDGASSDVTGNRYFGARVASDPFDFSVGGSTTPNIQYLVSHDVLFVGVETGKYYVEPLENIFSITSISIRLLSGFGCSSVMPVVFDRFMFSVDNTGTKLYRTAYSDENGRKSDIDVTSLNDDIVSFTTESDKNSNNNTISARFREISYNPNANSMFLRTSRNSLLCLTFKSDAKILAWSKTTRVVETICSLPTTAASEEWVLLLGTNHNVKLAFLQPSKTVKENYGGRLEYIVFPRTPDEFPSTGAPQLATFSPQQATNNYMESAFSYYVQNANVGDTLNEIFAPSAGDASNFLFSLDNFNVQVSINGVLIGEYLLKDGQFVDFPPIELQLLDHVQFGLPYTSTLKMMPLEAGAQYGFSRGNITRIDRLTLVVDRTVQVKFGEKIDDLEPVVFPEQFYTGDIRLDYKSSPDRVSQPIIVCDQPYPATICAVGARGVSYDG